MKDEKYGDTLWSSILIVLPALALVLSLIPGMLRIYDPDINQYVGCGLLNAPDSSIMSNFCPLLLVAMAYTLVLAICYYRSQSLGTMKAIFIFSVAVFVVCALALLPEKTLKPMPYSIILILWAIMSLISFIRMKKEIKRYDFD